MLWAEQTAPIVRMEDLSLLTRAVSHDQEVNQINREHPTQTNRS
jgi:hypothetical protein